MLVITGLKGGGSKGGKYKGTSKSLGGYHRGLGSLGFYALETPPFHNPMTTQKDNTFDAGAFRLARATEQLRAEHDKT